MKEKLGTPQTPGRAFPAPRHCYFDKVLLSSHRCLLAAANYVIILATLSRLESTI